MRLLAKHSGSYGRVLPEIRALAQSRHVKKRKVDDVPDLSELPRGQRRAVLAFIGVGLAKTYLEAAEEADMSLGTFKTHLTRVRLRHPRLYENIRAVRLAQLAERHEIALQNAKLHSRSYFRRKRNWEFRQLFGFYPWQIGR